MAELNKNGAVYNGRVFWSGCVSVLDGKIEEVHTYEEACRADFHHSFYFSSEAVEKMDAGESAFFFIKDGSICHGCRRDLPHWIIGSVQSQISCFKSLDEVSLLETNNNYGQAS